MPACIWQMWRATARHSFAHAYSNSHSDTDTNTNSHANSYTIFIFCCCPIFIYKSYSIFFQLFAATTLWLANPVFQRSMWKHDHVRWV